MLKRKVAYKCNILFSIVSTPLIESFPFQFSLLFASVTIYYTFNKFLLLMSTTHSPVFNLTHKVLISFSKQNPILFTLGLMFICLLHFIIYLFTFLFFSPSHSFHTHFFPIFVLHVFVVVGMRLIETTAKRHMIPNISTTFTSISRIYYIT